MWGIEGELIRYALWSAWASGLPQLMASRHAGQGGILAFHRVQDRSIRSLTTQSLSVTPESFRRVIQTVVRRGYTFLSMSALADWLQEPDAKTGRFVCLTFDDGFADIYTEVFPVCREFNLPMTVYLVPAYIRREFPVWLLGLEFMLAATDIVRFTWEGRELRFATRTDRQKRRAYAAIAPLLAAASPEKVRQVCSEMERYYGIDFGTLGDRNLLTLPMIAEMQASGLVEFGAHSVHHACLGRLDDAAAYREIAQSKADCEALLGAPVQHFAYPYGDSEAAGAREAAICRAVGFRTAVTTECNTIFSTDRERPFLLPRLTYNGRFQDTPLLELLLSGTLPRLRRALRTRGAAAAAEDPASTWGTSAEQA